LRSRTACAIVVLGQTTGKVGGLNNVSTLPKQQVQIRSLLTSRSLPLGLVEHQVDDWIKDNKLEDITYAGAEALINYLSSLPVTRPAQQAHLPNSCTSILVNKRKGLCALCHESVSAGLGLSVFDNRGWETYHLSDDCPSVTVLPKLAWDSDKLMSGLLKFIDKLEVLPQVITSQPDLLELSKAHDYPLGWDLSIPLLPFQRAGVQYALQARRVLLCDSMGLGKSCQAIALALDTKNNGYRTLVVIPPHLLSQWEKECKRFAPSLKVATVRGRTPYAIPKCDVLLIGDSVINAWAVKLTGVFNTLIVDEAHSLKNEKAGRTKGVNYLASSIPSNGMVVLMSGTMTPNRPAELISPLRIIGRLNNVFGSSKQFQIRYCDYRIINGYPNKNGATNTTELHNILRGTCMVRRRKEDVLLDLPPMRRAQIDVELSAQEMQVYRSAEDNFLTWVYTNYGRDAWIRAGKAEIITRMNKLREILGIAKIRIVADHCKSLLSEGEPVIVFAYHKKVIEGLRLALQEYGVEIVAGGSTALEKQESVDNFMSGKSKVFIGQYQSAGSGLNLTVASNVVLAEMCWSPSDGVQAESRAHRHLQTKPCTSWWMTAVDTQRPTIDMRLWSLLNTKAESVSAVLDGWAENLNADAGTMTAQLLKDMLEDY